MYLFDYLIAFFVYTRIFGILYTSGDFEHIAVLLPYYRVVIGQLDYLIPIRSSKMT